MTSSIQLLPHRYPFPGASVQQPSTIKPEECRLSLLFSTRVTTSVLVSSIAGLTLGFSYGSRDAGLRFRAENAHRLPSSSVGWYAYHKAKNYYVLNAGVREGLKMGAKCGLWVGGFFTAEEAVDRLRGTEDSASTVVAGLGVAGAFSIWNRFPLPVATRMARSGLLFGLTFGLMEDALAVARGQRVAYVDYLLGRRGSWRDTAKEDALGT
ncbi:MAG: hypothetical protein M1816_000896 [Peltula sp. TS41687]|nr:MAG: hypothetical protein M1816_000896 [Peltula sp. TS41687]